MALSVDTLLLNAAKITGLTDAAGSEDRALLDQFVNRGIFEIFKKTQCVVNRVSVGLTSGVDEYEMDRGVLTILNYAQSSAAPSVKISPVNATEIIERKFLQESGTIRYYSVMGGNKLIVSPTPDSAQTIYFYIVPVPNSVATTTDVFSTGLPTYAQRALECYVYARAMEANHDYQASRVRGQSVTFGSAAYWQGEFEAECGEIREIARKQGGRTLPRGRIGYPDRMARTPSRNDVYSSEFD